MTMEFTDRVSRVEPSATLATVSYTHLCSRPETSDRVVDRGRVRFDRQRVHVGPRIIDPDGRDLGDADRDAIVGP